MKYTVNQKTVVEYFVTTFQAWWNCLIFAWLFAFLIAKLRLLTSYLHGATKHWHGLRCKVSNKHWLTDRPIETVFLDKIFHRHFSDFRLILRHYPNSCQLPWHSRFSMQVVTFVIWVRPRIHSIIVNMMPAERYIQRYPLERRANWHKRHGTSR